MSMWSSTPLWHRVVKCWAETYDRKGSTAVIQASLGQIPLIGESGRLVEGGGYGDRISHLKL
jgi:hypothetical protein